MHPQRYQPPWYLRLYPAAHWQTIVPAMVGRYRLSLQYRRERLELPDGDFIDLDWAGDRANATAVLVIFHGLEGSSASPYVHQLGQSALDRRWLVCAVNARGCSGESNRLLRGYFAGDLADMSAVLQWVADQTTACGPLLAAGISLGGASLLYYLAKMGSDVPPQWCAGAAICPPLDLAVAAKCLERRSNALYAKVFLHGLKSKVRLKRRQFPNQIDYRWIERAKTIAEFDDRFTAPVNGFANVQQYWALQSCAPILHKINQPVLLLQAINDPIVPFATQQMESPIPSSFKMQDFIRWSVQPMGGHVGFMMSNGASWMATHVMNYFEEMISEWKNRSGHAQMATSSALL